MAEAESSEHPHLQKAIYGTLWDEFGRHDHMFDYTAVEALARTLEPYFVNGTPPPTLEDLQQIMATDGPMKQILTIDPKILRRVITSAALQHGNIVTIHAEDGEYTLPEDVVGIKVKKGTARIEEKGRDSFRMVGPEDARRTIPEKQGTSNMEVNSSSAIVNLTTAIHGRVVEAGEIGLSETTRILMSVKRTIRAVVTEEKKTAKAPTASTTDKLMKALELVQNAGQDPTINVSQVEEISGQVTRLIGTMPPQKKEPEQPQDLSTKTTTIKLFRLKKKEAPAAPAAN
ncbi:MAG: hypothetical protein WC269_03795 [Candidatus Gracilibacteria bacterium]|jgi:hypothetical protein